MRRLRGWFRRAVLLGLATGMLLAPAALAAPVTLTGGDSDWGVKLSFRNYIAGPIAHGDITTFDGAAPNPNGTFSFPVTGGNWEEATRAGEVTLAGKVRFRGHETPAGSANYLLYLEIDNVRLVLNGDAGTLYADVVSKSLSSGELEEFPGVDLASLNLTGITPAVSGDVLTWTGIPAALTANGAPAFAGFYPAGTALDPVSIAATFEEPPPASVDPASLDFGTQGLGTLSPSRTVTVTAGADPLAIDGLTTSGDHLDDFFVAGDTCSGAALAPGEECTFRVRFAPGAETVRQATISVLSDALGGPVEVALSGTGSPLGQGPQGARGPKGARGRPGRDAVVTCRFEGPRGNRRVVCRVEHRGNGRDSRSRARLIRRGRVYASGTARRLRADRRVPRGNYVLRLGTGSRARDLKVTVR